MDVAGLGLMVNGADSKVKETRLPFNKGPDKTRYMVFDFERHTGALVRKIVSY